MTLLQRFFAIMPCHSANAASTLAPRVDRAFNIALYVGAALFLALLVGCIVALVRRRATPTKAADRNGFGSAWAVTAWCIGMLAVACGLFWVGYMPYLYAAVAPADAYEIQATSSKGSWSFTYPSGKVSVNRLVVPRWRPVRLVMSSTDSVHGLYLPQFRLQQAAIPGRYTSIWFEATKATTMPIQCTEDCPAVSAAVGGTLSIIEPEQFEQWLALNDKPKRKPNSGNGGAKP